jgi:rsbT co-antagonist protein RsbR
VFRTLIQKVTICALFCLVLIVANAINALASINASDESISHLVEHTLKQADANAQFNFHLARAISEAEAFARNGGGKDRDEAFELLDKARADLTKLATVGENDGREHDTEVESELTALQERRAAVLAETEGRVNALVRAVQANDTGAVDRVLTTLEATEDEFEAFEESAASLTSREVNQATDELAQRTRIGRVIVPGSFGVMALLVLLALWLLRRFIVQPIQRLSVAAARVADGNLEQSINVTSNDEIGELQQSFNHMVVSLLDQREAIQSRNLELEQSLHHQQQLFETVQQLSAPLLPLIDGIVALPIVGHVDTQRANAITDTLLHGVSQRRARIAILDLTGIAALDAHVLRLLLQTAAATQLLGARVLLAGISAAMAQVIVEQRVDLGNLPTFRDLGSALQAAQVELADRSALAVIA